MSRQRRPNLPGLPFHITARLQNREPLLCGLEGRIIGLIHELAARGRVRIVAYAIMPNHIHIVAIQGPLPLGHYMQPLLRMVALTVMKRHSREGHVFERRYHAVPCLDANYFRNAIAYVHLNPVRAGICGRAESFAWSSAREFVGTRPATSAPHALAVSEALRMFVARRGGNEKACRRAYSAYLRHRLRCYELATAEDPPLPPPPPVCAAGDSAWETCYGRLAADAVVSEHARLTPVVPLRTIAERVLQARAPDLSLESLRSGTRVHPVVRVRRRFIGEALAAGYRNRQIARFLGVSTSTVSVVAARRWSAVVEG